MRSGGVLFEDPHHQALWLHDFGRGLAVQANTFLIQHDGEGMILDPGGPKVYPDVFAETTLRLGQGSLKYIFLSHQDPDIGTSLNAWLMDTDAVAYISRLWTRFLPHFGIDDLLEQRLHAIPDDGLSVHLAGAELRFIPAHFLHSPGNFQVYDPTARILFSGDLGAAPSCDESLVSDFDSHIPRMLGFHRRYMASRRAMQVWADRVRHLDIETIAPQHGAVFRGRPMVKRFIDWCSNLECGVDLL
ncbi:MAG: MBL fold metallo-hydrolase [Deltaproteobacteria bacterium]|nr:MBL fold metallo-hydrolase [Deltaproteobacteria bacterium]